MVLRVGMVLRTDMTRLNLSAFLPIERERLRIGSSMDCKIRSIKEAFLGLIH